MSIPMSSRDHILAKIKQNQPLATPLPALEPLAHTFENNLQQFAAVLTQIGGKVVEVNNYEQIQQYIEANFQPSGRMIGNVPALSILDNVYWKTQNPHELENVNLAVFEAVFGVAENGAVWLTDADMVQRVAPFICQHLAVVLPKNQIVSTMHDAYRRIADADYGFGIFIAGPSKTADIEQSLVLGAHGARTMTVFCI